MNCRFELALRAFDLDVLTVDVNLNASRDSDNSFTDTGHLYHTFAMTSPPTLSSRASWSVMTPLDVEMIA